MNVGVKYAEKQERKFEPEKLREGRNIIGLQVLALPHLGLAAELSRDGDGRGGGHRGAQEGTQVLQALWHRIFGFNSHIR